MQEKYLDKHQGNVQEKKYLNFIQTQSFFQERWIDVEKFLKDKYKFSISKVIHGINMPNLNINQEKQKEQDRFMNLHWNSKIWICQKVFGKIILILKFKYQNNKIKDLKKLENYIKGFWILQNI